MVFGIVDATQAREYNQDFRPLVEFLGYLFFLSVAFICCVLVVSVYIVLETELTRPGQSLNVGRKRGMHNRNNST